MSDVVRRMFEKLMTLELAVKFCYRDQNKIKLSFEWLLLHGVMIGITFYFVSF